MRKMSKITVIVPKPFRWLVGYDEEIEIREPFGTQLHKVVAHVIPNDTQGSVSEGGNSATVTLSCGHTLEWERPLTHAYDPLETWVDGLQCHVGHRMKCQQCTEKEE